MNDCRREREEERREGEERGRGERQRRERERGKEGKGRKGEEGEREKDKVIYISNSKNNKDKITKKAIKTLRNHNTLTNTHTQRVRHMLIYTRNQ